jgi:hypothetical protein
MLTNRELLTLGAMAVAHDDTRHTKAQITTILFLLDREAPKMFGGPHFDFMPTAFGPQDSSIDEVFVSLAKRSLVVIRKLRKSRLYRLSDDGAAVGDAHLAEMGAAQVHYLTKVCSCVRSTHALAMEDAITLKHPDMTIARTIRKS